MIVAGTLLAQMGWQVERQSRMVAAEDAISVGRGSEMLSLEAIAVLGVFFGLLVYVMVRTHPTDGWLALLTSVEDAGTRGL